MDESQLNYQLKSVKNYQGSFAIDELNEISIKYFPTFVSINLDKRNNLGTHWIAVAVYENEVYICDSLGGIIPDNSFPDHLINYLHVLLFSRKLFITRQLQPINSNTCGCYCIVFIQSMQSKKSFKNYLQLFSNNLYQNDEIIKFLC